MTPSRARLFTTVAELYDAVRPDYPTRLYDVLASAVEPLEQMRVLDLAAGTGLVTRALLARGASVAATDVVHGMLSELRRRTPAVPAAVAAAEALPFTDDSFDLVTCATAWHWVEPAPAVDQVRRVLRPGGHLALFAAGTCDRPEFEGKNGTPGASTKLAACCAYYPATEVRPRPDGAANVLMPAGADEAAHRAASPLTYVAKGFPPTVVFHGTADVTIPIESSERLFKQFREAQIPSEFHAFEGVPHAFDSNPEFAKTAAELSNFFIDRKVLHPRTYPPFGGGGGARGGRGRGGQ